MKNIFDKTVHTVKKFAEKYKEKTLNIVDFFEYSRLYSDVFITNDSSVFAVYELEGINYNGIANDTANNIYQTLESFFKSKGYPFSYSLIYHSYPINSKFDLETGKYPVLNEVFRLHSDSMTGHEKKIYLMICRKSSFWGKGFLKGIYEDLIANLSILESYLTPFCPTRLLDENLQAFFKNYISLDNCLKNKKAKPLEKEDLKNFANHVKPYYSLKEKTYSDIIEYRGADNKFAKIVSMDQLPYQLELGQIINLFKLNIPFLYTFNFVGIEKTSIIGKGKTTEIMTDQKKENIFKGDIVEGKITPYLFLFVGVIFGKSPEEARNNYRYFSETAVNSENANLNIYPLNTQKMTYLFCSHLTCFFQSGKIGTIMSNQNVASWFVPHKTPVGVLNSKIKFSTDNAYYGFKLKEKFDSNGHTAIFGKPGSGKTVLMQFLTSCWLAENKKIRFFDSNSGVYVFSQILNAKYRNFMEEGINPFSIRLNVQTKNFLSELLQTLGGVKKNDHEIIEKINDICGQLENYTAPNLEKISDLCFRGSPTNYASIKKYYPGNIKGGIFTDQKIKDSKAPFAVYDLIKVADTYGEEIGSIILSMIAEDFMASFVDEEKIVIIDEAPRYMMSEFWQNYIKVALRELRKLGGTLIFACQGVETVYSEGQSKLPLDSIQNYIFFPGCGINESNYKTFDLTPNDLDFLTNRAGHYVVFKSKDRNSEIFPVDLSHLGKYMKIYSSSAQDVSKMITGKREEYLKSYNLYQY